MTSTKKIQFTSVEINERIISEGGRNRLLPKNHTPVANKTAYTALLCEKLSEAVESHSSFRVTDKFATNLGKTKCYVKCKHGVKMPVSFMQEDLQEDRELDMTLVVKCNTCLQAEEQEPVASTATVPPANDLGANVQPSEMTATIQRLTADIVAVLNRANAEFLTASDGMQALKAQRHEMKAEIDRIWNQQMEMAFPEIVDNRQEAEIGDQQETEVGEQHEAVGEQQEALGEQQEAVGEQPEQGMRQNAYDIMMSGRGIAAIQRQRDQLSKRQRRE